jgi:hypothetical protein
MEGCPDAAPVLAKGLSRQRETYFTGVDSARSASIRSLKCGYQQDDAVSPLHFEGWRRHGASETTRNRP